MKKIEINEDLIKIIISAILFGISFFLRSNTIIYFIILLVSYIVVAYELFIEAFENIKEGEFFNEEFLMIIATIGAFAIKEYPEAVIVMLLFQLGEYLSDLAVDNSKDAITNLMDLRSDYANLKTENGIEKVDIREVKLGDVIVVKPGEKVPLDGIVLSGNGILDTSSLTGEAVPRKVEINDKVLSGFINIESILEVKTTSVYETSTASKIIELIEKSNDKKTETEKFITRFAKIYTPIVVILAVLLTAIPTILGYNFSDWLYKSLVFLVISCPCALVISVPLGFFCGIGRAGKEGILIKGSNELDNLSKIKAICFDKTGTITEGVFEVTEIENKDIEEDELFEIAAYAEYYSNHPIAKSILNKYKKEINKDEIRDFKEIKGKGIEVIVKNKKVIIGNDSFIQENGIIFEKIKSKGTIIYIAIDGVYRGSIVISDKIKEESYRLVDNLNKIGIEKIIMLSGDNEENVKTIADAVKIKEAYSNLLPTDKIEKVEKIKKQNFTCFVGDGINDAPVIKLSDIGIAMGGIGSDATIEAADVVLMRDDLNKIVDAIKISKLTKRKVKFNITFAIIAKIVVLLLGTIGISSVWAAVFADVGVTLMAVLNSLTIMKKKI